VDPGGGYILASRLLKTGSPSV